MKEITGDGERLPQVRRYIFYDSESFRIIHDFSARIGEAPGIFWRSNCAYAFHFDASIKHLIVLIVKHDKLFRIDSVKYVQKMQIYPRARKS